MKFNTLLEELLNEMPYIEIGNQIFDLEVERYKDNPKEFIQLIKQILRGEKVIGKYNSTIQLTTPKEKEEFLKKIKLNYIIKGVIPGKFLDSL